MDNGNFGRGRRRMNPNPFGPLGVGDFVTPLADPGTQATKPVGEITAIDARNNATLWWIVGEGPKEMHVSRLIRAPDGSERR
jgi:hypothetical protein